MCMIVQRPVGGGHITDEVIARAFTRHPDGFGLAWREGGELRHAKFGPKGTDEFRKMLRRLDKQDMEYVAHFRMATDGPPCKELSHPFIYEDAELGKVAVFHNGIIDIKHSAEESDTQVFVRDILAKMPAKWWYTQAFVNLVDMAVGWSKLVVMTNDETYNMHESAGEWDNGLWYSSQHKAYAWTPSSGKGGTGGAWNVNSDIGYSDETGYWDRTLNAWVEYSTPVLLAPAKVGDDDKYSTSDLDAMFDAALARNHGAPTKGWMHAGHELSTIRDIDKSVDAEYMDSVLCDQCSTIGDVYVIDGQAYVDMNHVFGTGVREEVEA